MPTVSATDQLRREIRQRNSQPDMTRLRELRTGAKLTQLSVANFVGVGSVMSVSEWERGLSSPSFRYWRKLQELMEILEEEMQAA